MIYDSPDVYERQVFVDACNGGYFTVARKVGPGRKDKKLFNSFPAAACDAFNDPGALVYAVSPTSQSTVVPRAKWREYNKLAAEILVKK